MATFAKLLAIGVAFGNAGAGRTLFVTFPVECDELPLSIAHRLVSPMFQQLHVGRAHITSGRYALLFLRGELDLRSGQSRVSVERAVPDRSSDQPDEKSQTRENQWTVIHA
jgi:hypothetical protein